jgi:hypothetical protein
MSVGAVLLQPQRVRRTAAAHDGGPIYDDAIALAVRLSYEAANGGQILQLLEQACEGAAQRFVARIESGFDAAVQKLEQRLGGLVSGLDGLTGSVGAIHDADSAVAAAKQLLGLLTKAAETLTMEHLRAELNALVEILEQDLKLGPDFLEQEALALLEDVAHHLAQAPPESDPELRRNRLQVVALLRRQRRRLDGPLDFPALDPERMAERLFELIEQSHTPEGAQRIAAAGNALTDAVGVSRDLLHVVPFTGFGATSVGAGAGATGSEEPPYCWYASWCRDEDVRGSDPAALSLFTTNDGTFTFKRSEPGTLETWAYVTAVVSNAIELVLHLVSLEEGDYMSNSINAGSHTGIGIYKLAAREPVNFWFELLVLRIGLTLITSFEGIHSKASFGNCAKMWAGTLLIPDLFEMYIYKGVADLVRDTLLTGITLRNYDGPSGAPDSGPDNRPLNSYKIDAPTDLAVLGMDYIMNAVFPKKDYQQPFASGSQALKIFLLWATVINTAFGLLGIALAVLVTDLMAGTRDFRMIPRQLARILIRTHLTFVPSLYQSREGKTSDGEYNPYGGPDFMGYTNFGTGTPRVKVENSTSPYKLPYAPGHSVYVPQGNQGLVSHNFRNGGQTYAYDFSLDQDVEILASRPGTIVAWWEDVENDTMGDPISWNFIAIRHDVDDDGDPRPIDQNFDLGPGGVPVGTIAVYGHGRKGSVTTALAINSLTPPPRTGSGSKAAVLTGTPVHVKQGMPIMLAGSTGISAQNHLHIHVIPDPGTGIGTLVPDDFIGNGDTMPFVFADVDRRFSLASLFFSTEGVPDHLNFHSSKNERVPQPT